MTQKELNKTTEALNRALAEITTKKLSEEQTRILQLRIFLYQVGRRNPMQAGALMGWLGAQLNMDIHDLEQLLATSEVEK